MKSKSNGIAMIEVLIAILIMAIGVIGSVGMQARATAALNDAGSRSDAVVAAERLIGLMWADQVNVANYAWTGTGTIPTPLANWVAETQAAIPGVNQTGCTPVACGISVTVASPVAPSTVTTVTVSITWQKGANGVVNTHSITAYLAPLT
jgi:type IV pilus assembly protein PilV